MTDKIIIDGKNKIFGRIATYIAKMSLLGYSVDLYNCDDVIISGKKKSVLNEYKAWYDIKDTLKGHFVSRMPHLFVKRMIRNMVPHKQARGREALARIKCYRAAPPQDAKLTVIPNSNLTKLSRPRYTKIKDICQKLGAKI